MYKKEKIVIFSGAGISAESGLKTFRDMGGLWESYKIEDVASIGGWIRNKELVLNFYNERRRQLSIVGPNEAHKLIGKIEQLYDVVVITQNVDDLHERGGSSNVIHLHGELIKACSEDKKLVYNIGYKDIFIGDKAGDGSQLRPYIVWFGEEVPEMERAVEECVNCDIFIVIGTSLQLYPAASLLYYVNNDADMIYIDTTASGNFGGKMRIIREKATIGMKIVYDELEKRYNNRRNI